MPVIQNAVLRVTLDEACPRVLEIRHPATGEVLLPNKAGDPVSVDAADGAPVFAGEDSRGCAWSGSGEQARFAWKLQHGTWALGIDGTFQLEGSDLTWTIDQAALDGPGGPVPVETLQFHGTFLASLPAGASYHRDMHVPCRWDTPRGRGLYDRTWETGGVGGAVPDSAPRPALVAGGWTTRVGVSVHSTQRYLPFVTQLCEGPHPERVESFRIAPSVLHCRARGRTLLPVSCRLGVFEDLNGDGVLDRNDVELWQRRRIPDADGYFRDMLWYKIYQADPGSAQVPFRDVMRFVRMFHHAGDGMRQVAYLVGWQEDGHDTGFPALDRLNPGLGTREDLLALMTDAERIGCTISAHLNLDDAYAANRGFTPDILCTDVDGSPFVWETFGPGLAHHISHTKDVETGQLFKRLDAFFSLFPVKETVHIDAFRCSNRSWGPEGYIGPVEELECGVKPLFDYLRKRGIAVSVESVDSQGTDLAGLIPAVWHITEPFLTFGKVLGGSRSMTPIGAALGGVIDLDVRADTTWDTICDWVYLHARLYHLYLTDELVSLDWRAGRRLEMRFGRGGRTTFWEDGARLLVTWDGIEVARDENRFIPVGEDRIYVYSTDGRDQEWVLPASWEGARIRSHILAPGGTVEGPDLYVHGRVIRMPMQKRRPVRLEKV